jgi:predicted dehydrogenase
LTLSELRGEKQTVFPEREMAGMRLVGVAVVGCGYWGPNLIRNFCDCSSTCVKAVFDQDTAAMVRIGRAYPTVRLAKRFAEILEDPEIEAVAVATPVCTHVALTEAALKAGKHVLVEKPMADNVAGGGRLVSLAKERSLVLMVDHVYMYNAAVQRIKTIVDSGSLGSIYYIDSVRINLGIFQDDVNVVWDLAPHDLSIVDYLLGHPPRTVSATGTSHTVSNQEDVAYLSLDFGEGLIATFHVNWLSPVKVRQMIIGGSKKSLVYNDLSPSEPIKVYDRGIEFDSSPESRHNALISYRMGDIWSPQVPRDEPLQNVVRSFAACIREGGDPLSNGAVGLRVVRILEAAQHSIKAQGSRITL